MTTDRDFDRITMAWLAEGPDELSDRVLDSVTDQIHLTRQRRAMRGPWRFRTMTIPARVAAAAAIGVLAVGGAFLVFRPGQPAVGAPSPSPNQSTPTVAPSAQPSKAGFATPALTETYTSARNGFAVSYPAGWTVTPATAIWSPGEQQGWGPISFDRIRTNDVRIQGGSQPLEPGQTPAAWNQANCDCAATFATMETVDIAGATGYRGADGSRPPYPGVAPDGVIFTAQVVSGGRGYLFVMDGHVDRAMFDAFLKTVRFVPVEAIDLPALTGTFTSPTYGYSIGVGKGWTTKPATTKWTGFGDRAPVVDEIGVTGTDTTVTATSQSFPASETLDGWEAQFRQNALQNLPVGCEGSDPSSGRIPVGDQWGTLEWYCNSAEALVLVHGQIYVFGWSNATATAADHLGFVTWGELLKSVKFDPASAN
jgi:hypothetical protein